MNKLLSLTFAILVMASCDSSQQTGVDGATGLNGQTGTNGHNALVNISAEPDSTNCANGGQRIETGLDTNDNGGLDASEVLAVRYICNSTDGINGANGTNGTNGVNGTNGTNGMNYYVQETEIINGVSGGVNIGLLLGEHDGYYTALTAQGYFADINAVNGMTNNYTIDYLNESKVWQYPNATFFYTTANCTGTPYIILSGLPQMGAALPVMSNYVTFVGPGIYANTVYHTTGATSANYAILSKYEVAANSLAGCTIMSVGQDEYLQPIAPIDYITSGVKVIFNTPLTIVQQ